MAVNNIFAKVPVQIPNKSGFDLSHNNLYTGRCGTLYPILVDSLIPGDKVSCGHNLIVQLPPMATDFFGNLNVKVEAFFVPNRILYGGWQRFITKQPLDNYQTSSDKPIKLPTVKVTYKDALVRGSLCDFLGVKLRSKETNVAETDKVPISFSALPFLAYHKIWEDWYRDPRLQKPIFTYFPDGQGMSGGLNYHYLPHHVSSEMNEIDPAVNFNNDFLKLRQRNFSKDYFTNSTYRPMGETSSLDFKVSSSKGSFTIGALRSANSLQQFLDRNQIAGTRYADQIKAQFGIYPSDAITDKSIFLGQQTVPVYTKGVFSTTVIGNGGGDTTNNPFPTVASKYGSSMAIDASSLVGDFQASEHGYFMVLISLVPDRLYSTGIRKYLTHTNLYDFAFPLLANMGDQEIMRYELSDYITENDGTQDVFGYTQRYSEYKSYPDEVHGELVDGSTLESFALQSTFNKYTGLGTSFIEIPQDYLKGIKAFSGLTASVADAENIDFWASSYFTYKKVSALPMYSIPTLEDIKDTHTEIIDNGGNRL